MRKSLRLFSCAVLGAAILAPTVVGNNHAQADSYYGRGYSNNYSYNSWYNNYYPNYGYNYGYNGYYPGYNYNYGYNYGYNNYYPNYNYGYNYNYNYGYNNYNPGYNNYNESGTYRYSNGYLYYILSDGSYYVNYNGRWVRGGDYNNNNSSSNNTPTTGYEVLRNDPHYRYENGTHYYLKDNGDYYYYSNGKWKLYNGTANDDPELDPDFHKPAGNDEYMYDDNASSVKLYSENVVGTGKAGEALPFQNVDEFKDYVIKNLAPKFIDNAGWDCNVTWEIEDVDNFNASKGSAWARDYVITANLKSGVDDKKYSDVEFGYVKFVYHVEPTENSDYVEVDSAKAAFNEINAQRTAAGLPALTWSDDLYNSTTLPYAKDISHTYNSDGIVYRRESDGSVVANKWLSSGIRELLMSPDATQAAVACVVAGDGTYYWTLNYQ